MKKALFTILALFGILAGAWADRVTDLSQLSNDKVYTLTSARAFLFYSEKLPTEICGSTGKAVGTVTANPLDPAQMFRIEKQGANYYLYSVGAGKYVSSNGQYEDTPSSILVLTPTSNSSYPWKLTIGGNGMNSQEPNQMDAGIVVNSWITEDLGNRYDIVETQLKLSYEVSVLGTDDAAAGVTFGEKTYRSGEVINADAPVKSSDLHAAAVDGTLPVVTLDGNNIYVSYFPGTAKFYTIMNGKGGYASLNPDYLNGGNLILTNSNTPRDNKGIWTLVSTGTNNVYKVYNYSTGLTKVLGMTGSEANARATMVATDNTTYKTEYTGTFNLGSTTNPSYVKINGTNDWWNLRSPYFALWTTGSVVGDEGSKFFFAEVDPTDFPDSYAYEVPSIEGVAQFTPKNPNTLWYKTSTAAAGSSYPWMEYALPLGNGELGCMVFGGVHNEELQFNEKTLWSGPADVVGAGSGNRTFMNFGSLFVENLDKAISDGVTDYVRYLDIEEGIAGVEFTNGNGSRFTRKYFSSAPDQVIAAQYKAVGEDKMSLMFTLKPGDGINASEVTYENGMASFSGAMTVKYATRLHVVADAGATVTTSAKGIKVTGATEVNFYLKGATNFNGDVESTEYFTSATADEVNQTVKETIEAAVAKGYEAVEADHVADFRAVTGRMTFDLGLTTPTMDTKALVDNYYPNNSAANSTANDHLFLEQLYFHYGRYLAISSNRKPIAAPNNLQGIWNDRGANSPWNSDIHTNINIQMNYWPTESTNLSDLHKPFVNFILRGAGSKGWKAVATRCNDGYGWSVLTESSLYNSMSTWGDNYLVANVWYTSHLWTHWRYTQDKEFLKKAFPAMWSCAQFWFHRLIEDRGFDSSQDEQSNVRNYRPAYKFDPDGTLVAPDEFSAEQHDNDKEDGTAHAQQMISYLFDNLSEAITILGLEETGLTLEDVATLNHFIEKTDRGLHTETYTGKWGTTYNGVKTGDQLLREWKYSPYDISSDKGHRHMSHLMALFPMDQITPESEFFTPAVNALKLRGDAATGWSMGWKVNLWARAQDGDHAHLIIKNALRHSTSYGTDQNAGGIYYNLFDSHAPFQIDGNFGVCSGVAECLMQSAHGYISVMPAVPAVWNRQGTVKGMKAIGNFTVDFSWTAGECQNIRIVSNAGAPLRVRCDKGAMEMDKACVKVNGTEVAVEVDEHGVATIPCVKDDVVEIDFTTQATGIASALETQGKTRLYDVSGRRISKAPARQVYIENGVKKIKK